MSVSSGVFTFPTTGIWLITHNVTFLDATEQNHLSCIITTTTDNSTYNSISISKTSLKLSSSFKRKSTFSFSLKIGMIIEYSINQKKLNKN